MIRRVVAVSIISFSFAISLYQATQTNLSFLSGIGISGLVSLCITCMMLSFKWIQTQVSKVWSSLFVALISGSIISSLSEGHIFPLFQEKVVNYFPFLTLFRLFTLYICFSVAWNNRDRWKILSLEITKNKAPSKRQSYILTNSSLCDKRLFTFISYNVFKGELILPKFLVQQAFTDIKSIDEETKGQAQIILEIVNKLELLSTIRLRWEQDHFDQATTRERKLALCAKKHGGTLLISNEELSQEWQQSSFQVFDIYAFVEALKPAIQPGEKVFIKIQREGKEQDQGIGYLEDGSMVVVNGGGKFIGMQIQIKIISIKPSTMGTGRIIFSYVDEEYIKRNIESSSLFSS